MSKKCIYIACGGSGGHIMPGLGVCNIFAKLPNTDIILVGVNRKENKIFFNNYISLTTFKNIKYFFLPDFNFTKVTPLNIPIYMVKLLMIILKIKRIFKRNNPVLVIGFGNYASFPVVFIALFFKSVFTIIHEQNLAFGKANKLLIPLVDKITVSFSHSIEFLKTIDNSLRLKLISQILHPFKRKLPIQKRVEITGNPSLIKENYFVRKRISLKGKDFINILIMGGSQGSDFLNYIVPKAFAIMNESLLDRIKVLHIVGVHDIGRMIGKYKKLGINHEIINFSFNMGSVYKKSDLVICRAGATTLSEIIFYQLPSILLPFKFGGGHQLKNAELFKNLEAAIVLDEYESDREKLCYSIKELIENTSLRKKFIANLKDLQYVNSSEKFMQIINQTGIFKEEFL